MPKLLGEKFQSYVRRQMAIRQVIHGSGVESKRSPKDLSILNSKTSWVKLASSLDITEERLREENLQDRFIGRNLAKEHVLFSGTSALDQDNEKLIQRGTVPPNNLFSTVNGVYTVNPTNDPYTGFGVVPMPGIESIDVSALNKGSIKETTVKIAAYSPEQFKVIDLLYLRIGYTVFLEYGWSHYIDNKTGKIGNDIMSFIDSKEGWFKENYWNKGGGGTNEILRLLHNYRQRYSGNWDGFLGRVKNFTWTIDENGKYSITLKLISLGDIIESLKTNLTPTSDVLSSINQGYKLFLQKNDATATDVTDISRVTDSLSSYIVLNLLYMGAQDPKTGAYRIDPNKPPADRKITSHYKNKKSSGKEKSTKLQGQFIFDKNTVHAKSTSQADKFDPDGGFWDDMDDLAVQIEKVYPGAKKIENFIDWQNEDSPGTYWTPFGNSVDETLAYIPGLGSDEANAVRDYNLENVYETSWGPGCYIKINIDNNGLISEGQTFKDVCYFNYNMGENKGNDENKSVYKKDEQGNPTLVPRGDYINDLTPTLNEILAKRKTIYKANTTDERFPSIVLENRVHTGDPGSTNGSRTQALDKINAKAPYTGTTGKGHGFRSQNANDFAHFRIGIMDPFIPQNAAYMNFRALIEDISDNYSAEWNAQKYMGRAEKFYKYGGFDRKMSLSFKVVVMSQAEMPAIYSKLNYLASSLAPSYSPQGYMAGNIALLTLGDYVHEQYGIITSLDYKIPPDSSWELIIGEGAGLDELPFMIDVSMNFTPIHDFRPEVGNHNRYITKNMRLPYSGKPLKNIRDDEYTPEEISPLPDPTPPPVVDPPPQPDPSPTTTPPTPINYAVVADNTRTNYAGQAAVERRAQDITDQMNQFKTPSSTNSNLGEGALDYFSNNNVPGMDGNLYAP